MTQLFQKMDAIFTNYQQSYDTLEFDFRPFALQVLNL